MRRLRRTDPVALLALAVAPLTGCYREVVSAKGLGAAAYQSEIGKGGNYSGLPFDDADKAPRRMYTTPGAGGSARARDKD